MSGPVEAPQRQPKRFCPECGQEYGPDDVRCTRDGTALLDLPDDDALVGQQLGVRYTILRNLGTGGMGSVYLARQHAMDRMVAIKVLRRAYADDKEAIGRFHREVKAVSRVQHVNCITVHDFGQTPDHGLLYIVMEYLQGRTLEGLLQEQGRFPPDRVARILGQVSDALAAAHWAGVLHRDLKSANVMLVPQAGNPDFVKVLDFGIAKVQTLEEATVTQPGTFCGTPAYLSPEAALGRPPDVRSDLYALGVLMFELVTGSLPFIDESPFGVMYKHVQEAVPALQDYLVDIEVPEAVQNFLERAMAKNPADRPPHALAFKQEMAAALGLLADVKAGRSRSLDRLLGSEAAPPASDAADAAFLPLGGVSSGAGATAESADSAARSATQGATGPADAAPPERAAAPAEFSAAAAGDTLVRRLEPLQPGTAAAGKTAAAATDGQTPAAPAQPEAPGRRNRAPRWVLAGGLLAAAVAAVLLVVSPPTCSGPRPSGEPAPAGPRAAGPPGSAAPDAAAAAAAPDAAGAPSLARAPADAGAAAPADAPPAGGPTPDAGAAPEPRTADVAADAVPAKADAAAPAPDATVRADAGPTAPAAVAGAAAKPPRGDRRPPRRGDKPRPGTPGSTAAGSPGAPSPSGAPGASRLSDDLVPVPVPVVPKIEPGL